LVFSSCVATAEHQTEV